MVNQFYVCAIASLAGLLFIVQGNTDPPPRPGGFHPIPANDSHLQPAVQFAAGQANLRSNCVFCQTLVGVSNASIKVVAGALYNFTMTLQESDKCHIKQCYHNVSSEACPPKSDAKPYTCETEVLATPWITAKPYSITNMTCDNMTSC